MKTIKFYEGNKLSEAKDFKEIRKLHSDRGALQEYYSCAAGKELNKRRKFAVLRVAGKPVTIATISPHYGALELMAYTKQKYRRKGYAVYTINKLLNKFKIPKKRKIAVYAYSVEKILDKLKYKTY